MDNSYRNSFINIRRSKGGYRGNFFLPEGTAGNKKRVLKVDCVKKKKKKKKKKQQQKSDLALFGFLWSDVVEHRMKLS